MALMIEKLIAASPKKEGQSTKCNIAKNVSNTTLLEVLAKRGYVTSYTTDDGTVKIKILVKKQELKQIIETLDNGNLNNDNSTTLQGASRKPSSWFERRLYDLMKRKRASQSKKRQSSNWKPALQSIPEEH